MILTTFLMASNVSVFILGALANTPGSHEAFGSPIYTSGKAELHLYTPHLNFRLSWYCTSLSFSTLDFASAALHLRGAAESRKQTD